MQAQKPSDEQIIALGKDGIGNIKVIIENPKWKKNADKPCLMLTLEIDDRLASRGEVNVPFSAAKTFEFLFRDQTLGKLNDQLKSAKVLHRISGEYETTVDRTVYKGIWPVSERDFVSVNFGAREGDCYYISSQSCGYPYEEQKGVVRGKIYIGGFKITAVDENNCHVIYVSDVDLMGSIPGMIKKQVSKKQGEVASHIEKVMKKEGV